LAKRAGNIRRRCVKTAQKPTSVYQVAGMTQEMEQDLFRGISRIFWVISLRFVLLNIGQRTPPSKIERKVE
jgi:hypothetical protein